MGGLRVTVVDPGAAFDRAGADAIVDALAARPRPSAVGATGRTPTGAYRVLATEHARDVAATHWFQLDEYVGLEPTDPRSLAGWMRRCLLDPLGVDPDTVTWLDGAVSDIDAECAAYDRAVDDAGGLDLAVLGLGPNGHLGFNEPPSDPSSPTRAVALSPASLASNAVYWPGRDVPQWAVTAGLSVLLSARRVVLLVSGATKREVLRDSIGGPVSETMPASFLQRHPDCHVIVDRDATPEG